MLKQNHKINSLNLGGYLFLSATALFVYYLLVMQDLLHFSIFPILTWTSQTSGQLHVLAIALVPVYVAVMIFGAALISILLGSALYRWLCNYLTTSL